MATATVPVPPPAANRSNDHDDAIRRAREVRALTPAREDSLFGEPLERLFLYGLTTDPGVNPLVGMLGALRADLAGFARLAVVAAPSSAADLVDLSEHLGLPLEGFVRRLDVAIELVNRIEGGRLARRARRAARRGKV